jgi:putative redox protein
MVKMDLVYEGNLRTQITHLTNQQTLHTAASLESDEASNFTPTDLLAAALGSCILTVIGIWAEKKGLDLKGMKIEIDKKMTPERRFHLDLKIWMPISLPQKEKELVERVATTCPVHRSLNENVEIKSSFYWNE